MNGKEGVAAVGILLLSIHHYRRFNAVVGVVRCGHRYFHYYWHDQTHFVKLPAGLVDTTPSLSSTWGDLVM
jgi:hypothetical protein